MHFLDSYYYSDREHDYNTFYNHRFDRDSIELLVLGDDIVDQMRKHEQRIDTKRVHNWL
jgi:hypothetical protein